MDTDLTRAAALLGVMSHPVRLGVLRWLGEGSAAVGELVRAMGVEQSGLSHHLKLLRDADLVRVQKVGRRRVYELADHHVSQIVRDALAHVAEG